MGMSIDEHIEVLKSYHHGFIGYAGNLQDSINIAINTMLKYQKIEQILKEIPYGGEVTVRRIQEVVEDATDRC